MHRYAKLFILSEPCFGRLRGLYREAKAKYVYCEDYRDPEPPEFDESTLKKIFFPKDLTEVDIKKDDSLSLEGLASQTDIKDSLTKVTKGVYKSVTSVQEAIRKRQRLLDSIPTLTKRELNKLTLPPSQHLLIELEEDGYLFSKAILQKLMELDNKIICLYEEREQKKLDRKPLSKNRYYLIVLSEALKLVEAYKKYGRKTEMYSLFMYLGEFFKGLHNSWLWLAYEMYKLAIDAIQGYRVDLGYGEALARYVLGKFCFEKMDEPEEALEHLEVAHKLSIRRLWNTESLSGNREEEIHTESTYLEHKVALALAHKIIDTNPQRATELGFKALKRVTETGKHPEIEDAQRSLAYLYERSKQPEIARTVLKKQIKQSEANKDYRGMSLGYYLKAQCYKIMKKYDNACHCLQTMIDLSTKHNEKDLEALGCKSLGEYYFSTDGHEKADEYLSRAVKKYMECGQVAEAARVSVHAGAVKAATHMSTYAKMIIQARSQEQAKQLLRWQMTEDLSEWYNISEKLFRGLSSVRKESFSHNVASIAKLSMPDHPRIMNSLLNSAEIKIVDTDSSDSD